MALCQHVDPDASLPAWERECNKSATVRCVLTTGEVVHLCDEHASRQDGVVESGPADRTRVEAQKATASGGWMEDHDPYRDRSPRDRDRAAGTSLPPANID